MTIIRLFLVGLLSAITALSFSLAAFAGTQDFRFAQFQADYYVSRDAESRSTMRVQERLVAEFPNYDQNHGIIRAIPKVYDGHPVSLEVKSVTGESGEKLTYQTSSAGDYEEVRIGDADIYVQGRQVYVIDYTLRDVTKAFDGGDELYWDINGTECQQPFDRVEARFHIDSSISERLDEK